MVFFNRNRFSASQNTPVLILVLLSLTGIITILFATPWGLGTTPDSVAYIRAARDFLAGNALHITHFAPLYPVLLGVVALSKIFGSDPLDSARWLNAIFFGANIFLVGLLIYRFSAGLVWPLIVGTLVMLVSVPMLTIHLMVWTEPAFIFLGFTGLALLALYLENSKVIVLVISGVFISLAFLTRYAGAALVLTGFLGILLFGTNFFLKRLGAAFAFGFVSAAPMLIWLLRNMSVAGTATSREILFHPVSRDHVWQAIFTFSRWFMLPDTAPNIFRLGLGAVIGAGIMVILFFKYQKHQASFHPVLSDAVYAPQLIKLLFLFTVVYGIFLVISISFLDANTTFDDRILSPVFVAAIILLLYLLDQAVRIFRLALLQQLILGVGIVAFMGFYIFAGTQLLFDSYTHGWGFSGVYWRNSEIIKQVNQFPQDLPVISNVPEALYLHAGRPMLPLPKKIRLVTRQVNSQYPAELAHIKDKIVNQKGIIVFLGNLNQDSQQTVTEINRELSLCILSQVNQDVILGLTPCR